MDFPLEPFGIYITFIDKVIYTFFFQIPFKSSHFLKAKKFLLDRNSIWKRFVLHFQQHSTIPITRYKAKIFIRIKSRITEISHFFPKKHEFVTLTSLKRRPSIVNVSKIHAIVQTFYDTVRANRLDLVLDWTTLFIMESHSRRSNSALIIAKLILVHPSTCDRSFSFSCYPDKFDARLLIHESNYSINQHRRVIHVFFISIR